MKHHYINKDKITEAWINEPYVPLETDVSWESQSNGWQVVLVVENRQITLEKKNKMECLEFLKKLNLLKL